MFAVYIISLGTIIWLWVICCLVAIATIIAKGILHTT